MENKAKVVIADYQLGNLFSVKHACNAVHLDAVISSEKELISKADALILPGVGAFGDAIKNITKLDLASPIRDFVATGKPILGICLGLQLLFEQSEEFGDYKGLGLIKGQVRKFPTVSPQGKSIRVPQIGWNKIYTPSHNKNIWKTTPLVETAENSYMYFVHSYYVEPTQINDVLCLTNYEGIEYCSAIRQNNICAFQFHPEKSAERGIQIYQQWSKMLLTSNSNG